MEISLLLKHLLPTELFEYFELVDLQESADNTLLFYLDEKNVKLLETIGHKTQNRQVVKKQTSEQSLKLKP